MVLLKALWPYILFLALAGYIYILHSTIKLERSEAKTVEQALAFQSMLIDENRAEYEAKIAELPKEIIKIKNHYITKYIEIEKWRERESDCNESVNYLNNFQY